MEMNDYVSLKAMEGGLSPYEQVKIGYMQNKNHTSGVGIAGNAAWDSVVWLAGRLFKKL